MKTEYKTKCNQSINRYWVSQPKKVSYSTQYRPIPASIGQYSVLQYQYRSTNIVASLPMYSAICSERIRGAQRCNNLSTDNQCSRIRILRFFQISKKHDFYVF